MSALAAPTSGVRSSASAISGEIPLTDEDFRRIASILHADSGIHLPDGKATLVYSRLAKRLRALGLQSFRDYCDLVSGSEGLTERQAMLTALTTNVTRFFREPHHFDDLRRQFEDGLAKFAEGGGKVRLWSAGCSSGEEPYSMALTVLSVLPKAPELDVRILATDIDVNILAKGRAGTYHLGGESSIPPTFRDRWLTRTDDGRWSAGEAMRELVAFRELNLMGAWPMKGRYQAIFCRNVAIYFEEATQERLWSRFAPMLTPDGRLYVGHSERVGDPQFRTVGLTAYALAGAPA